MDLLGDKAEEAHRQVSEVSQRLQDIESHVNALDSALGDFESRLDKIENQGGRGAEEAESNRSRIRDLERVFRRLSDINSKTMAKLEDMDDEYRGVDDAISGLNRKLVAFRKKQDSMDQRIKDLEEKVEEMENEFMLDTNRQDWDIENKLDSGRFNNRKKEVDRELGKLRASINSIAEELDGSPDIEIDD